MRILGLIPARGGSKGIPGKNIKLLAGMSLFERVFRTASQAHGLERIIVSTDSDEIFQEARRIGCDGPFMRPKGLARDTTPMIDVVIHSLSALVEKFDAVMLLQPTAALRTVRHIETAIKMLKSNDSVCSVVPLPKEVSVHTMFIQKSDGTLEFLIPDGSRISRRQDAPQIYKRDGTIYLTRTNVIMKERNFFGKRSVPLILAPSETINIDAPEDWAKAEEMVKRLCVE